MPRVIGSLLFARAVLLLAFCAAGCPSPCPAQGVGVPAAIRAASVTVYAGEGTVGSGTLTTTTDGTVWCLTAGHVVAKPGGHYPTVKVAQFKSDLDGKETETSVVAQVVRFDAKADLALLRVGKGVFGSPRVAFGQTAPVDSPVIHCGSYRGYHHSLSKGEVVALGRMISGKLMDQADFTGGPGASGGGVFTPAGQYVGMVVWGVEPRILCYLPIRSIRAWAKRSGVAFVLDPTLAVPAELPAEVETIPAPKK